MKTPYYKGEEKSIFDAVWQYILDHSDVKGNGVLLVKFHVTDKKSFAEKIASRMKGVFREGWKEQIMAERRYALANLKQDDVQENKFDT